MSNEIRKLINLVEGVVEEDYAEVIATIKELMLDMVEDYRYLETEDSNSRTTSVIYHHSGMIRVEQNVGIPGGYYGIDRTYPVFFKIGSKIDQSAREDIEEAFLDTMLRLGYGNTIRTDQGTLHYGTVSGTNWGGFGYFLV